MNMVKQQCLTKFLPFQVGVGVPSGAEAANHTCRKFVRKFMKDKFVLLKVDFVTHLITSEEITY